ncbi:MAG: alpha/beta fold hydrolase [Pseudolabrys sp.]|nr:alpha/beta fold hydrolase [Pseudolabrys sp.]MBV9954911.1 alpha/beta fold hydrolase [Pseudolabrys sp.]
MTIWKVLAVSAFVSFSTAGFAADYPAPKQGVWVAKEFKFHTGEVLPEVRLAYTTIGEPSGIPVVLLHGTGQTAQSLLTPNFAGELFGEGQALDAKKYYVVIPDALGHGRSSKPSDALKTKFPKYNYADMVDAQYRLLGEGLGLKRVRLVIGNSMGGMHVWLFGAMYPGFMDALVPMASQPTAMAARNYMMRKIMLETIKRDPEYAGGNYTTQPGIVKYAATFYQLATNGGTLNYQRMAPTGPQAEKVVDARLAVPFNADANDFVWAWSSSSDYDPEPLLGKIEAPVLLINAADDERNPPETGLTEAAMKKVKNGQVLLIPAGQQGHGTTGNAKLYAEQLREWLRSIPQRAG